MMVGRQADKELLLAALSFVIQWTGCVAARRRAGGTV